MAPLPWHDDDDDDDGVDDDDFPLIIKVASLPEARMQVYFLDNEDFFKRKFMFEDEEGSGEIREFENPIGATVVPTSGGSTTQITFYNYAEHFIANLPTDHEPVIRF